MKLSSKQLATFWRLFAKAWSAYCRGMGENVSDAGAATAWRREQVLEATGKDSLTKVDGRNDYTRLMLHLAMVANDQSAVEHYATNAERMMHHLIREKLVELGAIEGKRIGWEYARGIGSAMSLPLSVLMALDRHCRRIAVARGEAKQNRANASKMFGAGRRAKEIRAEATGIAQVGAA